MLRNRPFQRRRIQFAVEALERRTLLSGFSFGAPITINLPFCAGAAATGDFNEDGKADLVIAVTPGGTSPHPDQGTVAVLFGNGDGAFQPPVFIATGAGDASAVTVADINGDGIPDIITANDNGSVSILFGNGNGTFKPAEVYSGICFAPQAVAVGDFNGHPDIAIAAPFVDNNTVYGNVIIMMGDGDGTFSRSYKSMVVSGNPDSLAVGNFNGHADLVVGATFSPGCVLELGDGTGNFTPLILADHATATEAVQVADLNGDGLPDIIASSPSTLAVFLNNGNGTFKRLITQHNNSFYFVAAADDFPGDGYADLAEIDSLNPIGSIALSTGNGDGSFAPGVSLPASGNLGAVLPADLNGDGQIGIVAVHCYSEGQYGVLSVLPGDSPHGQVQFTSGASGTMTSGQPGSTLITTATTSPVALSLVDPGDLPPGGSFTDNGNGTGNLTAEFAATGTYVFTFVATNAQGDTATQQFSITVVPPPAFTSPSSAVFEAGWYNVFDVTISGDNLASISVLGAPIGINFLQSSSAGANTLQGIPSEAVVGTYNLTFTDSYGTDGLVTQDFTLIVQTPVSDPPAFTTPTDLANFSTGQFGTFCITTSGAVGSLAETGALPSGVSFVDEGNGTAIVSGTPAYGTDGCYSFTVTDTINGYAYTTADLQLNASLSNPPAFTSNGTVAFAPNRSGSFAITTSGIAGSLAEIGSLPPEITFADQGNGTGLLAGTPTSEDEGTYQVTLTDTLGSTVYATQDFTLIIYTGASPAFASAASATFIAGKTGSFTIITSGAVGSLGLIGPLPEGLNFTDQGNGTAVLSGIPYWGFEGTYFLRLTDTIAQTVCATQNLTLVVNDLPPGITSPASAAFAVGEPVWFNFTGSFGSGAFSEVGTLPAGLSFVSMGQISYIWGIATTSMLGAYHLVLTDMNDVGATATQDFTLTIVPPVQLTSAASAQFVSGRANNFTVIGNGDPNLSFSESGGLPAGVTFQDNQNGTATLIGKPRASADGIYDLTLTATDGIDTATQSFTLYIAAARTAHVQGPASATITVADANWALPAWTAFGYPMPTLTETGALPDGITFDNTSAGMATLTGTAAADSAGVYHMTIHAGAQIERFTLTVAAPPEFTSSAEANFVPGETGSFSAVTTGFPAAKVSESGALPSGLHFKTMPSGAAMICGKSASVGTYALILTATNATGMTATQDFTLTVSRPTTSAAILPPAIVEPMPLQLPTSITLPSLTEDEANLLTEL